MKRRQRPTNAVDNRQCLRDFDSTAHTRRRLSLSRALGPCAVLKRIWCSGTVWAALNGSLRSHLELAASVSRDVDENLAHCMLLHCFLGRSGVLQRETTKRELAQYPA